MSGLTAQFVVLLMFSCSFVLCEGTLEVTVKVGEDATLQCQKTTDESISAIEWSRSDLKTEDYVFYCRDNKLYESYQLPCFHGRVELKDPEMKNGDASVILKNVTVNDTGTYECFVRTRSGGRRRRDTEPTQSVTLKVVQSGHRERGNLMAPFIAVVICVVGLVGFVGFVLWKRQRRQKQNPTQPADDEAELQTLSSSSNHCV